MRDASFASGFVHAQDRLWSMHVKRRAAAGRLSEFGGALTKDADLFFRTVGLRRTAEASIKNLDARTLELLQAYS